MARAKATPPQRETVKEAIESFVSHEAARISPRTARNFYGYPLQALLVPFCEEEGIAAVDELSPEVHSSAFWGPPGKGMMLPS